MVASLVVSLAVALVVGVAAPRPPAPASIAAIPDEPGVVFVADGQPTLQAVVADLDGDGIREVVRLGLRGDGVMIADAWREEDGRWTRAAEPVVTVTNGGGQAERAFFGRPVRLLVRAVDGRDRVTLVRQPDFTQPEDDIGCCLLVDDVRLGDGVLRLAQVAEPGPVADAVHAIDLDGDGTDELLATSSLPPLGDVSYPIEARVLRWAGDAFARPVLTALPIGSGDTPFLLGNSDGVPGDEAGIISVTGRPDLFRLVLESGDRLRAEAAGMVVTDARAVPLGEGRGVAVASPVLGLAVMPWPSGEELGEPVARASVARAEALGVVGDVEGARLVVRDEGGVTQVLWLPSLEPVVASPASGTAEALRPGPLRPYAGPLPGGVEGRAAVIAEGRLVVGAGSSDVAAFPGTEPVGLAGGDEGWLALLHAPSASTALDPRGGRLTAPAFAPASTLTLVPRDVAFRPEPEAAYGPATSATIPLPNGEVAVPDEPFVVDVEGPAGSLVYLAAPGSGDPGPGRPLDASGRRRLTVVPRADPGADGADPVAVIVVTPAGHGYRAEWRLRVVGAAPEIQASTETPFGSAHVTVAGRTAPYAEVTVAGAPAAVDADGRFAARVPLPPWPTVVRVVARDPFGHEATAIVTGVGVLDYRTLPWVPMVALLALLAGIGLYLRVPRSRSVARSASDDAALEELDPDART